MMSGVSSEICEVMAARTRSDVASLKESGDTTKAGRLLAVLRSVNGKETRTMSPRLKLVVDGIGRVIPEIETLFGSFQPAEHLAEIVEFFIGKHGIDLAGLCALDLLEGLEHAIPVCGLDAHWVPQIIPSLKSRAIEAVLIVASSASGDKLNRSKWLAPLQPSGA
jgi:hypothetical protein